MAPHELPHSVFERLTDCLEQSLEHRAAALEDLKSDYPEHAEAIQAWLDTANLACRGRLAPATDSPAGGQLVGETWLQAGSTFGPYSLERRLGEGAQGVVFLAVDTRTGERRALKVLKEFSRQDPRFVERFEREVTIATKIRHPNVCRVHDGGILDGVPYIAMDYVSGETLHEKNSREREASRSGHSRHTRGSPEPIADKIRCIEALLRGVHAMHEAGVVHRDIKPANIVVREDGSPVLMDFGIARDESLRTLTRTGDLLGTPAYMSPEQLTFSAIKLDRRTDIWSLGAVLYEHLTLERPFEAPTRDALYHMILTKEPTDIRRLNRAVSPDMRTVVETALEKDRDRRFVSAQVFADELQRILDGKSLVVRPISTIGRLRRWASRNPAAALGIAVSLALLLAGIMVSSLFWYRASNNLAEWNRLADLRKLEDLATAADELWPATPGKVGGLEAWLGEAQELYEHLPAHVRALEALRRRGQSEPGASAHPAWAFDDAAEQFKHDKLAELVERLHSLGEGQSSFEVNMHSVRQRVTLAESLRLRLATEDHDAWVRCRADLARSDSIYAGLSLEPLPGLVPLGWDRESRHWEFWHVASGTRPRWDGEPLGPGRASLNADDGGMVLVLLPAQEFTMGAEIGSGPAGLEALKNEGPPQRVRLDAYLISKWEVSQGQWQNTFGDNPSMYRPGVEAGLSITLRHPATDMSLQRALDACRRWDLEVPTEAQWECACRAGTTTPFAFGSSVEDLAGAINLADRSATSFNGVRPFESFDDTFAVHAPVDALRCNALGIPNMHGNVWEWCRDHACDYDASTPRDGDGLRESTNPPPEVILRGGGYFDIASSCRSTFRFVWSSSGHNAVGLRPVRSIRKPS